MSASLAVPRERKKLVWQSSWHVKRRSSVITRQQGIQGLGAMPWGMTPLDTAWQRCCIQSAISASLSALSSRQGRSARMTWKAWGRSVVLDLRQPPHCSPLGQRKSVKWEGGGRSGRP